MCREMFSSSWVCHHSSIRTTISNANFGDAKQSATILALDALRAIYEFEIEYYNDRDMAWLRVSNGQLIIEVNSKGVESEGELQVLKESLCFIEF
ncbi:hypothetical protein GH714_000168 [Hevea brasiliensis]|uniref:Uncharacterized protein n=1 Tax=Hevea brasiliensis TaxID=3981 RepID=A0A6A6LJ18_HEVBR|nr:hypothetical protein GH714_000168 [Hevea brasiliensis]